MSNALTLVRISQPCVGIQCPADLSGGIGYARDEIRRFIQKRTGCNLPDHEVVGKAIRLVIDPDLLHTHREAYRISSDQSGIQIAGASRPAVVFGVMDFLETEIDIGFAGLGDAGIRAEYTPTLTVAVQDRICSPDLDHRAMHFGIHEDMAEWLGMLSTLRIERLDWMAQHRMNYVVLDPPVCNYNKNDQPEECEGWQHIEALFPEAHKRGIKVQWGHHCWNRWVPASKYFQQHPEYYALVDGARVARNMQLSLCTSNPEVAQVMAQEMLALLDRHPEVDLLSIWPEDGTGRCQCDNCEALTDLPSGSHHMKVPGTDDEIFISCHDPKKTYIYTEFINRVARIVAKSRPDVKLSALYYWDIDAPPEGIKLEENVIPTVSLYWRCSRHALDHPNCENIYFNRILEQWTEQYPNRVVIETKPMGMTAYVGLPWPIAPQWHQDWQRLKKMGVIGGSLQSQAANMTVYGPNYATFARMGWDINRSTDDLKSPYFHNLYAQASKPVLEMQSILEDRFYHHDCDLETRVFVDENLFHGHPSFRKHFSDCIYPLPDTIARILDEPTFDQLHKCLDNADALAKNDRVRLNIKKLRAAYDYWLLVYQFQVTLAKARRAAAKHEHHLPELIGHCLLTCRNVVDYLDTMPYRDVLARCLGLNLCWLRQTNQLIEWQKNPAKGVPAGIKKWP